MSNRKFLSTALIIIGIISATGAVYFFTSNQYKPRIMDLEEKLASSISINEQLNSTINRVYVISTNQNSSINELIQIISSLQIKVSELEEDIVSLTEVYNEKSQDLIKYKNITREFYKVNPIRIGFTAASDYDVSFIEDLAEKAEQEIHIYCTENDLPYRFEFVIGNNLGLDDMALTNTLTYDTLGINMVVGHGVDSQCSSSLNYVNDNDMLLLSYGSSSNEMVEIDNLYRLSPNETVQFQANLACMKALDIEHVVVFVERSDWGKEMSQMAVDVLSENNINVSIINFSDNPIVNLTPKLEELSDLIYNLTYRYGEDHVAVQLIGDSRISDIIKSSYMNTFDVIWFGTGSTMYADLGTGNDGARSVLFLCPAPVSRSDKFIDFRDEVLDSYDFEVSYYGASAYDACWLYALSIIDSGSTQTEVIRESLEKVAEDYIGVSGGCSLNSFGDRINVDYRIMGYYSPDGNFVEYGYYNSVNQTVKFTRIHPKIPS